MPCIWSYQTSPLKGVSFSVYSVHRQQDCNIIPRKREGQNSHSMCSCPTADDCIEDVLVPVFRRSKRGLYTAWHPTRYKRYIQEQWIEGDRLVWNHFGNEGPVQQTTSRQCMVNVRGMLSTHTQIYSPSHRSSRKCRYAMTSTESREKPWERSTTGQEVYQQ